MKDVVIGFDRVTFSYEEGPAVISNWTIEVPGGVTSLIGRNGTGKSTFLLLASARLLPQNGTIYLEGRDTQTLDDDQKNALASVVYQNMEFENEESLGDLLRFVRENGKSDRSSVPPVDEIVQIFELKDCLHQKTQTLSKGQLQRAVMAFSLLYGSRIVVMDEPVFALEDRQKRTILNYIADYARRSDRSFLFSAHELELSQTHSDNLVLFFPNQPPLVGLTKQIFTQENIENAYQTPLALLKQKESLYRLQLRALSGL